MLVCNGSVLPVGFASECSRSRRRGTAQMNGAFLEARDLLLLARSCHTAEAARAYSKVAFRTAGRVVCRGPTMRDAGLRQLLALFPCAHLNCFSASFSWPRRRAPPFLLLLARRPATPGT